MKARVAVACLAVILCLGLWALPAAAEGTSCGNETILIPDGRITESTIPASTTFFYLISASRVGRSYSVEFKNTNGAAFPTPGTLTVFSDSCTTVLTTRTTTGIDPSAEFATERVSFIPTTIQTRFRLVNGGASAVNYSFSASETTLFNPLWSTFGGFETFYRFQNTTNSSCSVTLTLKNDAGTTVATATIAISAGSTAPTRNTGPTDLVVADNQAGQGLIVHDCPPGAIQADGFLGNFTGGQNVVLPIKIVAAREATH